MSSPSEEKVTVRSNELETLASGVAHQINTPAQYLTDNIWFLKAAFITIEGAVQLGSELANAVRTNTVTPELRKRAEQMFQSDDLNYCMKQVPAALADMLNGVERISSVVNSLQERAAGTAARTTPRSGASCKSPMPPGVP